MRPTPLLRGASRLPLTTKRANKDYYKGTRQSYVPGGGHRTGPPGKHVVNGTAKYRVLDEEVRYYVGPGIDVLQKTSLKPYVAAHTPLAQNAPKLPSFAPKPPKRLGVQGRKAWSKAYAELGINDRAALIQDARRNWFQALSAQFGPRVKASKEGKEGKAAVSGPVDPTAGGEAVKA
ncbi:hypothetical protein CC85DRAFT_286450 [Cutaneotrichosporon oleaginosum]|uniref:Uncharacterized protein n=1 Tax=Cutaneotrichosporon oleaginosum TaxID=879819 RepID=A0A0J0XK09_9TREE|nr:uncharacterized protein CC85DRAFT_286450 [Cutaneotrichosporon oleaginosum]KLT41421.1 hypothetical protein CC85DRAFT_286450 [Cutaneotrichosporon oleaginosum]TXT12184.1 hypothetical protein COLE_02594 [Cutaneotrichosporon oleaginosum]